MGASLPHPVSAVDRTGGSADLVPVPCSLPVLRAHPLPVSHALVLLNPHPSLSTGSIPSMYKHTWDLGILNSPLSLTSPLLSFPSWISHWKETEGNTPSTLHPAHIPLVSICSTQRHPHDLYTHKLSWAPECSTGRLIHQTFVKYFLCDRH